MYKLMVNLGETLSLEIEAADIRDLIKKSVLWSEIPRDCPICGSDLSLMYRNPKDFEYFGLRCKGDPAHVVSFGEYKDTNLGFYYVADRWSLDQRGAVTREQDHTAPGDQTPPTNRTPTTGSSFVKDDIPF